MRTPLPQLPSARRPAILGKEAVAQRLSIAGRPGELLAGRLLRNDRWSRGNLGRTLFHVEPGRAPRPFRARSGRSTWNCPLLRSGHRQRSTDARPTGATRRPRHGRPRGAITKTPTGRRHNSTVTCLTRSGRRAQPSTTTAPAVDELPHIEREDWPSTRDFSWTHDAQNQLTEKPPPKRPR